MMPLTMAMNLVNCALFSALLLNMDRKPTLETLTEYYGKARKD